MPRAEWIERMRDVPVLLVAEALGFTTDGHKQTPGAWTISCPACGHDKRHRRTEPQGARGRGAVGIPKRAPSSWHCHQCEAQGDALSFIAHAVGGGKLSAPARAWSMSWLGLDSSTTIVEPARARPMPIALERPPEYPQIDEVRALWATCKRVDEVPEVAEWLTCKRIDPSAAADADLFRALHPDVRLPRWTRFRRTDEAVSDWRAGGYLLVAQLVDTRAEVRSVLARSVRAAVEPKSRAPGGFERRELVLACPLARQVLASAARPKWWPLDQPLRFEIAEGEKKWAMRATIRSDAYAPACIGIESGSWSDELAARLPDGSSVFIATDPNVAGARYATTIIESLLPRIASGAIRVELHPLLELHADTRGPTVRVKS